MTKRRLTNEEFVSNLMRFNPSGAICQMFIIEAIRVYSERWKDVDPSQLSGGIWNMIAPQAWTACAKHIHSELIAANYTQPQPEQVSEASDV